MHRGLLRIVGLLALTSAACSNVATPEPAQPQPPSAAASPISGQGEEEGFVTSMGLLEVKPIWHGTVAFSVADKVILVDPWSKAPAGRMPKADLILITDIHPDHLDPAAVELASKAGTIIVGPAAVAARLDGVVVLANDEERSELGITIRAIPMYNVKRGPEEGKLFHDKGRGNGYLLGFGDTTVYVSGDTECTAEMRALEKVDLALVCMNLPYTMPPEEAAECIQAFRPKVVMPFHYRGSDLDVLARMLEGEQGIELRVRDFYKP